MGALRWKEITLTAAGSAGSATASGTITGVIGEIEKVAVTPGTLVNTADLTGKVDAGEGGEETFLNLTDIAANDVIIPRGFEHDAAGADITVATSTKVTRRFVASGILTFALAQADPDDTVTIRVYYRR